MPTPFDDLYTAAKEIMADVNTAAATTLTQAPTNYGTDFRITPGAAVYQVQMSPEKDYGNSNDSNPRAIVTVLIHHYVYGADAAAKLANEESFLHNAMSYVADKLLVPSIWSAEPGVYGLQPGVDPEVSDGSRTGNVITFEVSAAVLADAV
jgi:hypothetical protein